ncbi:MAG: bifunctional phosphopantothenoylcysteine decarboxylase/phosphopantothenate--cysteine ligase CoaBC [Pseudomonadota bacterium]
MLSGKRILLIIGGGIAAFKALDLMRRIRERSASVVPVMTTAAAEFLTPLSVSALAAEKVYTDLFDLNDEAEMGHIELSRDADVVLVVPATADLMAKMANGLANDLASTVLMATDKPVLISPAMNVRMWEHPATQRNLAQLERDGVTVIGPVEGPMACGEYGPGRMSDTPDILAALEAHFGKAPTGPLLGHHVVVTSGPTHEPIDPVRYIANRSSGAQGTAIAAALRDLGAEVSFVTGPASVPPPDGVNVIRVETAREMLNATQAALPARVAVCAAAVADWHIASASDEKIKKTKDGLPELDFKENPDILAAIASAGEARPELVIGFAAETQNVVEYATQKRTRKGCDWIVANDVSPETGIMGGSENAVTLISEAGAEAWPRMDKTAVAKRLADRVAKALGQ